MLGRKQSIAKEALTDYGEEMLNESADIEWINKVSSKIQYEKTKIVIISL